MTPASRGLFPPFALVAIGSAVMAFGGPLAERPGLWLSAYLLAGLGWAWALSVARRRRGSLTGVFVGAICLQALACAAEPGTSRDAYRIVWEGEVILRGRSPYAYAPDDRLNLDLARERAALHAAVEHRDVPAAYPPLAQAIGAGVAGAARALEVAEPRTPVLWLRIVFAACSLAALLPLAALLRRRSLSPALALAWGWSPLAAFEIGGAAHLEGLALPALIAALSLAATSEPPRGRLRDVGASLLFAAAVLAKPVALALWPWFVRERRTTLRAATVLGACAVAFVPFLALDSAGRGMLGGISEYAFRWDGGSLVHRFVEGGFGRLSERDLSWSDPRRLARAVLALAWLVWAGRTWLRERDPARAALDLFGAWLVLTPALHPWYLLWVVPWLALRRSPAFVWLAAAAPLLFAPVPGWVHSGAWHEPAWLWPVLALPFAVLLAWSARAPHPRAPA